MISNLLSTKFFIPSPRSNFVLRENLLGQLDEALDHKLTLIAAPPGYGKSTLLSIWTHQRNNPVAWLSIDSEDNDPALFFQYLITALQTINPNIGSDSLALLKSPQWSSQTALLTSLINDLADFPDDIFLVLDDYHWIEQSEIHDALNYLIDHLPAQIHLIVASRSDPSLQLSRLRARGQLVEIRQKDLSLNTNETREFLNHCMGLDLSTDQVDILGSRTEGWVAGLQLAALSIQGKDQKTEFIETFSGSHRFVIDYLADEVISNQSPEVRSFFQETAVLDRFSADLCDFITGREDSTQILRYLEESNSFLIPLDDRREWFRYHHLFLDYLRIGMEEQSQAALHIKASQWFLSHDFNSEGVKHAILSGDVDQAVRAISLAASLAIEQGTFSSLFSWLDTLPDQVVRSNFQLSMYKSFALFFTDSYREASPYAQAAEENLPTDIPTSLQGQYYCLQAHLSLFTDQLKNGIKFAREALEYLADDDTFYRGLTLNLLGQVLEMRGDVKSAVEIYQQGFNSGYQAKEMIGTLVVFTNLVISLNELGRLKEAKGVCQQLYSEIYEKSSAKRMLSNAVYLPWSHLSYEENKLEEARKQAKSALDVLNQSKVNQGIILSLYILARLHLVEQEWDKFSQLIREGLQIAARTGTANTHGAWFSALEAEANLVRGNMEAVSRWAEKVGFRPDDSPHHWLEWSYFTYTRFLLKLDRLKEAQQILTAMEASALEGQRFRKLITINLLMAHADLNMNKQSSAIQHVDAALSIAAPQGYQRAFFDEDQAILEMLPEVRDKYPEFVDEILSKASYALAAPSNTDPLYEPLSERELEVLRLVAKGYSNRQIAEALFVTLGTVKKHLNNTFSKLQVKNRTQAVARARELDFLA